MLRHASVWDESEAGRREKYEAGSSLRVPAWAAAKGEEMRSVPS